MIELKKEINANGKASPPALAFEQHTK